MDPTHSMEAMSDGALGVQPWDITFIGGTVEAEASVHQATAVPTHLGDQCLPLAMTAVGDCVWVVQIKGGHNLIRRLTDLGVVPGNKITVVSRTESGSVIVGLSQGCRIGLGAGMAHKVMVTTTQQPVRQTAAPQLPIQPSIPPTNGESAMSETLHLGALAVGQSGHVVGYEKSQRGYRQKLLSMGLTPGTHFTVTRQAPMGDPIEIEVRGFKLSLRKGEAAALKVKPLVVEAVRHD